MMTILLLSLTFILSSGNDVVFVSTTPFAEEVRAINKIPFDKACDLVKWNLIIHGHDQNSGRFTLRTEWGFYINHNSYEKRGTNQDIKGTWEITKAPDVFPDSKLLILTTDESKAQLKLLRVNENLLHILRADDRLSIGNGGWSFTLGRKEPVDNATPDFSFIPSLKWTGNRLMVHGRTPCQEGIANGKDVPVKEDCYKLKWIFSFQKNDEAPSTFEARRVISNVLNEGSGTWTTEIKKYGVHEVVLYRLSFRDGSMIYLVQGDENVFFFVNKEGIPLTGTHEFGYTLDVRIK